MLRPVIWSLVHVTKHVMLLPLPAIGHQCLLTWKRRHGTYNYPANTGAFFFLLLVVLLGELYELVRTYIIAKPKPLLAHARADLNSKLTFCYCPLVPLLTLPVDTLG